MDYIHIVVLLLLIVVAQTTYLVVATSTKNKRTSRHSIYVDTSVLIDGRILSIAEAGFVPGELVVPRSVLRELQLLADGGDSDKRAKARKGLDLIRQLQSIDTVDVRIMQDGVAARGVDEQLIELAKKYQGSICTVDYNLNKVARVEGIIVLNINELAKNIRAVHMPGEQLSIEVVARGQGSNQGVGYLEDGTMVVIENASKRVGDMVNVEFIRVLQTDAGKMMFAKPVASSVRAVASKTDISSASVKRTSAPRRPNGRGRSQAQNTNTAADTSTDTKPVEPLPVQTQQDKPPQKKEQRRTVRQKPQRRKTNEDSLIDLIKDQ